MSNGHELAARAGSAISRRLGRLHRQPLVNPTEESGKPGMASTPVLIGKAEIKIGAGDGDHADRDWSGQRAYPSGFEQPVGECLEGQCIVASGLCVPKNQTRT